MKHLLFCICITFIFFKISPALAQKRSSILASPAATHDSAEADRLSHIQIQELINHGDNSNTRIILRALLDRHEGKDLVSSLLDALIELNYSTETATTLAYEYYSETGKVPLSEVYILTLITGAERPNHIEPEQALLLALVTGRRDVVTLSNVLALSGYSNKKDGEAKALAELISVL